MAEKIVTENSLFPLTANFKSMGSPCEIRLYCKNFQHGKQVLKSAANIVKNLNDKYSRYLPNSLTTAINSSAGKNKFVPLDEETLDLFNYADKCFQESQGTFDITSGILRKIWNFKEMLSPDNLPNQKSIEELLPLIGWQNVERKDDAVRLPYEGMEIDFGGIVKEYAADRVSSFCKENHIYCGLVNLGGDIAIIGPYPDSDGTWSINIQNPDKSSNRTKKIQIDKGAVATSGVYERYFTINGKRYSHLLNAKTGWPIESEVLSLTIQAPHCIVAGSIATIAMLKGKDCLNWLQANEGFNFWCYYGDGNCYIRK